MPPTDPPIDVTDILAQPREFAQRLARVERERAELIETVARLRAALAEYENGRWHSFETVQAIVTERDSAAAEIERLTAALDALIKQADVAWATLDHTENERLVSRIGDAVDNARAALRQPAPAQGQE